MSARSAQFRQQLALVAHEFQIGLFGFRVLGLLRRDETSGGFDPESFRSCRHRDNEQKFWTFRLSIQIFAWLRFGQRSPEQEGGSRGRCTKD
jgi:hypothetical protein